MNVGSLVGPAILPGWHDEHLPKNLFPRYLGMSTAKKTLVPDISRLVPRRRLVSDSIASGLIFALTLTVAQRVVGFGRGILFCRLMTDQQLGPCNLPINCWFNWTWIRPAS